MKSLSVFSGIAASPGIAIGKVLILKEQNRTIEKKTIESVEEELIKFDKAIANSKNELELIRIKTLETMGAEKAQIFEAHLMVLEDPELIDQTKNSISSEFVNSEWAFKNITSSFIQIFEEMEDEYLRERAADIKDVSARVLSHLQGHTQIDLSLISENVIIVAQDLTPSQTATMNKANVLGFLTDIGGKTSHSAIMARTLEIPAIVGLKDLSRHLRQGDLVAFDGATGKVVAHPSEETIAAHLEKKQQDHLVKSELQKQFGLESITLDGHKVELAGNIGGPGDVDSLIKNDAEAIGLYRTEFVFMDRQTMPSEQEQYEYYSQVLKRFGPKNCIIRTLDIGGDKKLDYLNIAHEMNPFLGYRAIRICLKETSLFKTQLRALLRASTEGKLSIMFPMISCLEELLEAKNILQATKDELTQEGIKYAPNIKIGAMIEVPSAALISDILARHVDFFSIGTNDLTQYTCAVDRMNEQIEHLYNPYSLGLLRLINMTIKNGNNNNIMVGLCGSMAHQTDLVPLFLGMGLFEFSMSPMHILSTRKLIRKLNYKKCQELAGKVLMLNTTEEVKLMLGEFYDEHRLF
jgi:phosphotransferase system enzyme I (PtsI)